MFGFDTVHIDRYDSIVGGVGTGDKLYALLPLMLKQSLNEGFQAQKNGTGSWFMSQSRFRYVWSDAFWKFSK